jgi:hypothetical protein
MITPPLEGLLVSFHAILTLYVFHYAKRYRVRICFQFHYHLTYQKA